MKFVITFSLLFLFCAESLKGVPYDSPDFAKAERLLEGTPDLESLRATGLGDALLEVALNLPELRDPLQARGMALAWVVGSSEVRETVIRADFYLRLGRFPEGDPVLAPGDLQSAKVAVEKCRTMLAGLNSEEAELTFHQMVMNLLVSADRAGISTTDRDGEPDYGAETIPLWSQIDAAMSPVGITPAMTQTTNVETESEAVFGGNQSTINGLLVMEIEGSEFAGGASKMNATLSGEGRFSEKTYAHFTEDVGPLMKGALEEVERFLHVRHEDMPLGHRVAISFEERASMKDGPSAAVACALLLESIISGVELEQAFAVTGDMNADGAVQPVGGIDGKIRGAVKARCTHVAIPKENRKSVSDIFLLEGPAEMCRIQIFSIEDFDEAFSLAKASDQRSPELAEAMKLFSEVAAVVGRPGGQGMLVNPHVIERLRRVLQLAPNHLSAELLLRSGMGSAPTHLSLAGSFTALDRCLKPMNAVRESRDFTSKIEPLKDSIINLRRIRNQLDPRTKDVCDNIEDLYAALSDIEPGMPSTSPRLKQAIEDMNRASDRLDAAYAALRSDPDVQEELNM